MQAYLTDSPPVGGSLQASSAQVPRSKNFSIVTMYPTLLSLGPVSISSFGAFLVIAFFAGSFVVWKKGREEHFEEEDLFDATLLATFWGLIGARVWYILFHLGEFGVDVIKMMALTKFPGLSFLGALPVGILALVLISRKKKWEIFEALDVFVLGVVLAQALGFIGALLNGSGYGTRSVLPWAVNFVGVEGARHPTQIYGAILLLVVFIVLLKVFREYRTYAWYQGGETTVLAGLTFFSYLLGIGVIGVVLAFLKPADLYWLGFAAEGWVSGGWLLAGLAGAYIRSGRKLRRDLSGIGKQIGRTKKKPSKEQREERETTRRSRKKRERGITAGVDVK